MKRTCAIFLILLFATQAFSKWMILTSFDINRSFIAQQLCVNRQKPVACLGKCQLVRELQEGEQAPEGTAKQLHFEETVYMATQTATVELPSASGITHCFLYCWPHPAEPDFSIFHPPA